MNVNWLRFAGAVIALSSGTALWIAVDERIERDRFQNCQAEVLDAAITAINARSVPAEKDRMALKQVFLDVAHATSREQTLAAINRFNAAMSLTEEERRGLPLPEPPRMACDADD